MPACFNSLNMHVNDEWIIIRSISLHIKVAARLFSLTTAASWLVGKERGWFTAMCKAKICPCLFLYIDLYVDGLLIHILTVRLYLRCSSVTSLVFTLAFSVQSKRIKRTWASIMSLCETQWDVKVAASLIKSCVNQGRTVHLVKMGYVNA